ncbi:MAG: PQQ-binding-like beta-propeller repeat protein [Chloroflexi bacterium]|nr:PQQ-binding-like beta-propeller repeat protein [Chloroflexota bacterium]
MTSPLRSERDAWHATARRSARSRFRTRWLAFAGMVGAILLVWGLWVSGVFTGPVPLPATQVNAPVDRNDWAMAGRDAAHTAAAPFHGGFEGEELWRLEARHPLPAAPAVSGGQLFLGTGDNRLVAMDSASGDVLWERRISSVTVTAPAVTQGAVYVAVRDGRLLALDRREGAELWSFQADSSSFASPTVYQGVVYAGSWNGTLYAVDAQTGEQLWTFRAEGSIVAPPAFQGDLMALATDDGLVYVIDLITGKKRLIFDTVNALAESPVFTGDYFLIGTGRGRLAAIDWTRLEYPLERALRSWRQQFFIWGLQPEPPLPKGLVWGRVLSRDSALSGPAVLDGVAYAASRDGRLHALSIADGTLLWEYDTGALIHSAPAAAGRSVYIGNDAGEVHVIDRATGEPVRIIQAGIPVSSRIVLTERRLYVTSGEAGTLIALR